MEGEISRANVRVFLSQVFLIFSRNGWFSFICKEAKFGFAFRRRKASSR